MSIVSESTHLYAFAVAKWKELGPSEEKVITGNLFRKDLLRIGASAAKGQPFLAASFDVMYDDSVLECEQKDCTLQSRSSISREDKALDLLCRKILAPEFRASGTANLDEVGISVQIFNCHAFDSSL